MTKTELQKRKKSGDIEIVGKRINISGSLASFILKNTQSPQHEELLKELETVILKREMIEKAQLKLKL